MDTPGTDSVGPKQWVAKQETLRNVQGLQVGQSAKLLAILRNARWEEAMQFVRQYLTLGIAVECCQAPKWVLQCLQAGSTFRECHRCRMCELHVRGCTSMKRCRRVVWQSRSQRRRGVHRGGMHSWVALKKSW